MSEIVFINHLTNTVVLLDDKQVGEICRVEGGYRYYPKGKRNGGELFETREACKKDVAGDTPFRNW